MTPRAIDVCAGAGGLSLGLQRAGFDVLGVEHDEDACETHHSQVGPCDLADVTTWHPPGPVDLVAGGVPCQPFSNAGKRQGVRDVRGSLFEQLVRVAVESSARVVLLENVRGMVSLGMVPVIEAAYRAAGYEPVSALLNAVDYGMVAPCPLHDSGCLTGDVQRVGSNSLAATRPAFAALPATATQRREREDDALTVAAALAAPMSAAFAGAATAPERLQRLLQLARRENSTPIGEAGGTWTSEAMSVCGWEADTAESIASWLKVFWDALSSQGRLSTTATETPATIAQKTLRCIAATVATGLHTGMARFTAGCGLCVDEGVPQHRVRLFVVGFRRPEDRAAFRWPAPTHGPPGGVLGLPPWVTVRQALGLEGAFRTGRTERAEERGWWNGGRYADVDAPAHAVLGKHADDLLARLDAPSPCVTAREQCSALAFGSHGAQTRPRRAGDVLNPVLSRLDRPAPTVCGGGTDTGGAEPLGNQRVRRSLSAELAAAGLLDRPGTTMDTTDGIAPACVHERDKPAVRLTVAHLAALQGFPAGFAFAGNVTSQHRQVGNAVPPPLAEALGRAILRALTATGRAAA